ncbi:MAG: AraC family transcriptional regulator [Saccharofermentans sp.]|jgi:YesN/AraC family two-component response regulator|nr:AraC family transcriptional regulator [Mageeibacillus sp.]MCI1264759.1 AraC family transcriptional regulator [Saccharofermentans sp.]MCI1274586.1 AraC family transcriptional regulator [Saccharofermentans sp.]MCI2043872.1 AraC family transcriptional regulator [Mageeibacillus sp.]
MNIEKELAKRLINDGESVNRQESYSREINFYELVASGRTASLEDNLKDFGNVQKLGKLSSNELQNVKYHAVILAAMVSRFCIESGMEISVAYTLSDIYIELIDVATSINEVNDLQKDLLRAYCQRMNEQAKSKVVSRHIVMTIDYIRSHIQESLTVESIADSLSLNSSYLSKLFKQEMGITLSRYIRNQKIDVACSMLRHLDESSLSIANYLGFSSQSHFIQVFKKTMGITPEDYRRKNYHQSWMKGENN